MANINTGAAFVFSRPMLFNGVEMKAGDRVPSTVAEKKLRFLQTAGHIRLGLTAPDPQQNNRR